MKKILILAPHPDDEIVGACIIIKKFLEKNCDISIFFLTNGVISKKKMWFFERYKYSKFVNRRLLEAKKTLKELGVKKYFLQNIPTRCLKKNIKKTYSRLNRIIKNNDFDCLFVPAYEGGHQDHDIANFISSFFIKKLKVFEYPEYNFFSKKVNSNSFPKKLGNEVFLSLSQYEILYKKKLLNNYKSEKKNLNYLEIASECYRPIAKYDYRLPPHEGILFYRRFAKFSWHPRVDSTTPESVCESFMDFEKNYEK